MNKNYVKEHKGRKVPEGAIFYQEDSDLYRESFWDVKGNVWVVGIYDRWVKPSRGMPGELIELPEVPQEWNGEGLPPIGCECEVDIAESTGLSRQELELNGEKVSVISNVKNKRGFEVTVFEISDGGVFCFSSELFHPLKTQQEKDREAFIARCVSLTQLDGSMAVEGFGIAYDDGARFTVPKAGE